jgi:hypothetical protein
MNERIRELAKQAGDYVNEVYTPPVRSKTPGKIWEDGHIGWNEQFQAKFAELIVQECIDIIAPYTVRMSRPGEEYLHPILEIKEHFGVEE